MTKALLLRGTAPSSLIGDPDPSSGAPKGCTDQNRIRPQQSQLPRPRRRQRPDIGPREHDDDGSDDGDDDGGDDNSPPDTFVPDPFVWKELGVSSMTGWRWAHDPTLDFPVAVRIRGRNFRSRRQLERWKQRMLRRAIAQHANAAAARKPRTKD
jgi:hypothetical protein